MEFLIRTFSLAGLIGIALCSLSAGIIPADPADDFSFSLHYPVVQNESQTSYRLMSESRVTQILEDHLEDVKEEDIPRLARHILSLCHQYRFEPAFVLSLIQAESTFRARALSPAGAVGLMQLMPSTAQVILKTLRPLGFDFPNRMTYDQVVAKLVDPFFNISLGIAYLAFLRDRYQTLSPYYILAAYNVGPARLEELMSRKAFRPAKTVKYYEDIRKAVPGFRFYRSANEAEGRSV